MPNLETLRNGSQRDLALLPASAYRAVRYADWRDSVYCTVSANRYVCRTLPASQRRRALASFELALVPRWTIVDVGERGASAYRQPASAPAAYSPFGAMALDAVRRLRRWRYYDAPELPAPAPNQALDGCKCRVCLSR